MSRQYQNAARAVDSVLRNASSLQAHCASQARVGKTEYALACETLKFIHVIDNLFNVCGISAEKLDVDRGMLYVYTYELLFGKGKIQGGGVVKRRLMEQRALLEEALRKELRKQNAAGPQNLLDKRIQEFQQLPVYVRINRIKDPGRSSVAELEQLYGRCPMDQHIEDLVVLPPKTKGLGQLELVKSGILIIQDKASCMPSQILGDAWRNGDVVDACAAPGNKTSHIAAIINQRINAVRDMNLSPHPKIFAFDKSARRAELLGRRMTEAGADSLVECRNEDFTAIDIDDPLFSNVTAVLVDPSCSGSGVCRNLDRVVDRLHDADPALSETGGPASCTEDRGKLQHDRERLEQLRSFQVRAVLKALSFPHATTVVYSTCSIHEVEGISSCSSYMCTYFS
jgi:putative methyltransferase